MFFRLPFFFLGLRSPFSPILSFGIIFRFFTGYHQAWSMIREWEKMKARLYVEHDAV